MIGIGAGCGLFLGRKGAVCVQAGTLSRDG